MPTDKWGIPFIYPTKTFAGVTTSTAPFFYEQSNNISNDANFNGEGDITDHGNGEWTLNTDGPTSVQIFRNSDSADSIGGCDMHFEQTADREYGYKASDPRDVEITWLMKFQGGSGAGFALEGPTGRHSSSQCCQGFSYKIDIDWESNPPVFRYRKEMWHVSNHTDPTTGEWTSPDFNFNLENHANWVGFKYIIYKKIGGANSGHNTPDSMVIELWGNPNATASLTTWKLLKRTEDKGGWGDDGDVCNGDDDQIGVWSNSNFRFKSNANNGQYRMKMVSCREIDPTKSFDDDPGQPPGDPTGTTEIVGTFTLKRDINSLRTSTCEGVGGGGAGSSALFYNSPQDGSDGNWGFHHGVEPDKIRIGIKAMTSQSTLCNRPPIKVAEFYMDKVGSPTGTATCKIRGSVGGVPTDRATIGTLDVSTLTSSWDLKTFTNASNTYSMVAGDRIIIEFTSGDASNYVRVYVNESLNVTNGVYTKAAFFDDTTDLWTDDGSREVAGKLWA